MNNRLGFCCPFVGKETKIGQHFTSDDELRLFESEQNKIWEGNKFFRYTSMSFQNIEIAVTVDDNDDDDDDDNDDDNDDVMTIMIMMTMITMTLVI